VARTSVRPGGRRPALTKRAAVPVSGAPGLSGDQSGHPVHRLLEGEIAGIHPVRVRRPAQGSDPPLRVGPVARAQVALDRAHVAPPLVGRTAGGPHFRAGVEEDFDRSLGEDHGTDVPPLDDPAGGGRLAPAAHYHMGGVYTDIDGRTTVRGLYAAGECASTGAHGANRVASNSLLEAAVFSTRVVTAIQRDDRPAPPPGEVRSLRSYPSGSAPSWQTLRRAMNELVGITRTAGDLRMALDRFDEWREPDDLPAEPSLPLATLTARLIAEAALQRTETRGAHLRLDFPDADCAWQRHSLWQMAVE